MGLKKKGGSRKKRAQKAAVVLTSWHQANSSRFQTVLQIVASDTSFKKIEDDCWVGKCFYCGRRFFIPSSGVTFATIEHIRPRSRGGTNDLKNLALACVNCNNEKGRNADRKAPDEYFDKLLAKRLEQWREPVV
jgi:5-methylcytosine-specific restriction endonuclease McrA